MKKSQAAKSTTDSPMKRPGRPRNETGPVMTTAARTNASNELLHSMVKDATFLRAPASEGAILKTIANTSIKRNGIRDAIIQLIEAGLLETRREGVCRAQIDLNGLIELYAQRYQIERRSTGTLVGMSATGRLSVTGHLLQVVHRQLELSNCADADIDDRVEWFLKSIELHVQMAQGAGYRQLAMTLRRILWQLRICTFRELEEASYRMSAAKEHLRIIDSIVDGTFDQEWFLRDQIRTQFQHALLSLGFIRKSDETLPNSDSDGRVEMYWNMVVDFFK